MLVGKVYFSSASPQIMLELMVGQDLQKNSKEVSDLDPRDLSAPATFLHFTCQTEEVTEILSFQK